MEIEDKRVLVTGSSRGLGAIDILVNNAGVAGFGNPLTMDFEIVQEELAVNYLGVITVMPTTIDTDMSRGANVPKLTKEFVAAEILDSIREERHDPPIGDEAKGVFENLAKDAVAFEKVLQDYRKAL